MTEKEVIERLNRFKTIKVLYGNTFAIHLEQLEQLQNDIETVLNLLEKQKAEISDLKWKNEIYVKSIKSHDRYEIELNDEIIEKNNKIFDLEAKIEKKDKVIDLMAKELVKAHEWFYSEFDNYTKEDFIKYFERKVEEEK